MGGKGSGRKSKAWHARQAKLAREAEEAAKLQQGNSDPSFDEEPFEEVPQMKVVPDEVPFEPVSAPKDATEPPPSPKTGFGAGVNEDELNTILSQFDRKGPQPSSEPTQDAKTEESKPRIVMRGKDLLFLMNMIVPNGIALFYNWVRGTKLDPHDFKLLRLTKEEKEELEESADYIAEHYIRLSPIWVFVLGTCATYAFKISAISAKHKAMKAEEAEVVEEEIE